MEHFTIHARVLRINVVGQTAFFNVQIRGIVFENKKIPHDFPVETLAAEEEFTIHFGNPDEMTEAEIAAIYPDRIITMNAERGDTKEVLIKKVVPYRTAPEMSFSEHIAYLEKIAGFPKS